MNVCAATEWRGRAKMVPDRRGCLVKRRKESRRDDLTTSSLSCNIAPRRYTGLLHCRWLYPCVWLATMTESAMAKLSLFPCVYIPAKEAIYSTSACYRLQIFKEMNDTEKCANISEAKEKSGLMAHWWTVPFGCLVFMADAVPSSSSIHDSIQGNAFDITQQIESLGDFISRKLGDYEALWIKSRHDELYILPRSSRSWSCPSSLRLQKGDVG